MANVNNKPFRPPNAEQVARLLEQHPPRPPSRWLAWSPILLMGLVVLALASGFDIIAWFVALGGLLAISYRVKYVRQLETQVAKVDEQTMLRWYPNALRTSWKLIPKVAHMPTMHGRVIAMLAHCLDQVKSYEAAIVAYDFLIGHLPGDHPVAMQLKINRSIAQLHNEQLLDADDTLRRMRNLPEQFEKTPISASLAHANLAQQVQTNHLDDALAAAATLVDELRPLGILAGYGYGLMAYVCYELSKQDRPMLATEAAVWWSRATLMLPADTLVDRYPQLESIAQVLADDRSSSVAPWGGVR